MRRCEVCSKVFIHFKNYERHLKTQSHIQRKKGETTFHSCPCGKTFFHKSGLSRHQKKCSQHSKIEEELSKELEDTIQTHEKEKEEMQREINELKQQLKTPRTVNNHSHNKIDTQNVVNINVRAFGDENLDYVSEQFILKCIGQIYNSIPALLEHIHFNKDHPENHNVKIKNKKLPQASIVTGKGKERKWKTVTRDHAIDHMIDRGYNILDETFQNKKDSISLFQKKSFGQFQQKFEDDDPFVMKTVTGRIDNIILDSTRS